MRKLIDFNKLLQGANLLIAVLLAFRLSQGLSWDYVDQETLILGLLLCAQTQVALILERRRRDPFVLLLAMEMVCYYTLRIYTLTLDPFSVVFDRFTFETADMNRALVFILVANIALYAGLRFARGEGEPVKNTEWTAVSPGRIAVLIIVAIIFDYVRSTYWTENGGIPRQYQWLTLFLTPGIIGLMSITYYFIYRRSLSQRFIVLLMLLIAVEMGLATLLGSRSAIFGFIQNFLVAILAVFGSFQMQRRYVWLAALVVPVIIGLLIASFAIGTFNRAKKEVGVSFDVSRALEVAKDPAEDLSVGASLPDVLPQLWARAAFLDFSAELMANQDRYRVLINPTTYAESIVDNILTPGFDVYGQPLVAQSLQFIYADMGKPSKEVISENYQSDQLGVYGEFYVLAGYWCLPVLFLVTYALKRVYLAFRDPQPFQLVMKRIVVLFIYMQFIRSFGIDYIILVTLPLVASMYLYRWFFASRRVLVPPDPIDQQVAIS